MNDSEIRFLNVILPEINKDVATTIFEYSAKMCQHCKCKTLFYGKCKHNTCAKCKIKCPSCNIWRCKSVKIKMKKIKMNKYIECRWNPEESRFDQVIKCLACDEILDVPILEAHCFPYLFV